MSAGKWPYSQCEADQNSARIFRQLMRRYALVWRAYCKAEEKAHRSAQDALHSAIRMRDKAHAYEKAAAAEHHNP